jgi:hypothetical protein
MIREVTNAKKTDHHRRFSYIIRFILSCLDDHFNIFILTITSQKIQKKTCQYYSNRKY